MDPREDRRRAHGARLALTMAENEASWGDYERAVYWSEIAELGLDRLPRRFQDRRTEWRAAAAASSPAHP